MRHSKSSRPALKHVDVGLAPRAPLRAGLGVSGELLSPEPIYLHRKTAQYALPALLILLSGGVIEEPVQLLEGLVLGLGDEEECPDPSEGGKGREEYECPPADALEHGRDDEADDEVEKPVRC